MTLNKAELLFLSLGQSFDSYTFASTLCAVDSTVDMPWVVVSPPLAPLDLGVQEDFPKRGKGDDETKWERC